MRFSRSRQMVARSARHSSSSRCCHTNLGRSVELRRSMCPSRAADGLSPIPQLIQIPLAHAEVMADLVQDGLADLLDEVRLGAADLLDWFLEDVDDVGKPARIFDAALGARAALVEAEQQSPAIHLQTMKLLARRSIANLDRHLIQKVGELRREQIERPPDQLVKFAFAHSESHR